MKPLKETIIDSAFNVEAIYSVYEKMKHTPERTDKKLTYNFWQLYYIENGCYLVQMEDGPILNMKKGQILFAAPNSLRTSHKSIDTVVSIVNIKCTSPNMKFFKNRVFDLSEKEQNKLKLIMNKGGEIFKSIPDDAPTPYAGQQPLSGTKSYQLQRLKNYIELFLIEIYENYLHIEYENTKIRYSTNYYEAKFHMISDYLKDNIEKKFSIYDICKYAGFSQSTIKRIFQSEAGCGVIHYFLKLKVNKAKQLLSETDLTIAQISEQLGFTDVYHFSKTFKRFTGKSPKKYTQPVEDNNHLSN